MFDFDSMPQETLQKLFDEDRPKLQAPDAGTGLSHMNREAVLTEKLAIARRLNRMAFSLKMRDAIAADEFAKITDECRPYLAHVATPSMESAHT